MVWVGRQAASDMKDVQSEGYTVAREDLFDWADTLLRDFTVRGPVLKKRGHTVFERIEDPSSLHLDYCSTMLGPRNFIYPQRQELLHVQRTSGQTRIVTPAPSARNILFAIHPCDMHAITVLDRTFSRDSWDFYYNKLRHETITVVLNCATACDQGFCSSMGTGPFLKIKDGYDVEITPVEGTYIIEFGSRRGRDLIRKNRDLRRTTGADFSKKKRAEKRAEASFTKFLDTKGLPELLARTLDHSVYKLTADTRCLNCTNCTMVCPTCYCYNIEDLTRFNLKQVERKRHWDSCHELNFARVHGGNFRSSREARLRQFVTHKLCTWVEQYGCFGCIGCGRCMAWCPTGIDLTEMAKEIQRDCGVAEKR